MPKKGQNKRNNIKISLYYYQILYDPFEIEEKKAEKNNIDPISDLISSLKEINDIFKNTNPDNLMKFIYYKKDKIHSILYEENENIKLDSLIKNNISNYFYLDLLLKDNPNCINYEYSYKVIDNIKMQLEKEENILKKLVISILLKALISNFEQISEEIDKIDKIKLEEKEVSSISSIIESCKNKLNLKNIEIEDKIDKVYAVVISKILKKELTFEDKNDLSIIKMLEQMDLENINITKNIYDKLKEELNKEEIKKKYKISNKKDLYSEETINFYYILFKYIFKSSYYIYQIPLISDSRIAILKMIKSSKDYLIDIDNKKNNSNLEYILDFIVDSKYYKNKYYHQNSKKNAANAQILESSIKNSLSTTIKTQKLNAENEEDYKILKLEKIIKNKKKNEKKDIKNISIDFIKEMSNGYFIFSGLEDILYVYNRDLILKIDIKFGFPNVEQKSLNTQENSCQIKASKFKNTQNIIETNKSKAKVSLRKTNIELIDCSKYGLSLYILDIENSVRNKNIAQIDLSCNGFFEINGQYIAFGEKGIFHFEQRPFDLNLYNNDNNADSNKDNDKYGSYKRDKRNFKGGIKINNNLITLTSNKILPNGDDIIIFYNIENKCIIKEYTGFSCIVGINGLFLLKKEKINILLYACKKYLSDQQNGILLIVLDLKEKGGIKDNSFCQINFKNIEYLEVNCFCQISIKGEKTDYFLVGGFDNEKRIGVIKLFKIVFKDKIDIEFIDDIDFEDYSINLRGSVNCIVQSHSGKILVSCLNKKVYVFSEPNIDFYLNWDKKNLLN